MFAARDQENVAFHRQNNAAMKQLQKTPGARYPKTPIKVPLNDENAAHAIKGAKSIGGSRIGGNENIMTSKANKSQFVTPMHPRSRAVLGDKTTNAKAKGMQSVNVKSTIREIEQTGSKVPATARPRQKQPQAETQKLQVHAEIDDLLSEDEPEYCPPKPVDLPYESDVFPDGVLTFNALKPENMFKGYYQHYFNPIDEDGVSLADKRLAESTRKALEEGERRIREDMDNFEWASVKELQDENAAAKKAQAKSPMPNANPVKRTTARGLALRQTPSNTMARRAAGSLSIDDATRSVQRRAVPPTRQTGVSIKKAGPVIPRFASTKTMTTKSAVPSSRTTLQRRSLEAASRSTIGFNKGRTTASIINRGPAQFSSFKTRDPVPRSRLVASRDSDKTVTQTRFAKSSAANIAARTAAAEDAEWKDRVPFLSIFAHDDDDEGVNDEGDDFSLLIGGGAPPMHVDLDDEDFEIRILE